MAKNAGIEPQAPM